MIRLAADYEGVDVLESYFGVPTVATRLENLADLTYPENSFDLVISNQSMEHWGEFGCSLHWGLYQCFRVCKLGGSLCLNVPIYFHGTSDFMLGRLNRILGPMLALYGRCAIRKLGTTVRRDTAGLSLPWLLATAQTSSIYPRHPNDQNPRNYFREQAAIHADGPIRPDLELSCSPSIFTEC